MGTEKLGDGFSVLCRTHLGSGGPVQGVYQEEVLTGERLGGGGGREGADLRLFRRNLLVLAGHQPAAGQDEEQGQDHQPDWRSPLGALEQVADARLRLPGGAGEGGREGRVRTWAGQDWSSSFLFWTALTA